MVNAHDTSEEHADVKETRRRGDGRGEKKRGEEWDMLLQNGICLEFTATEVPTDFDEVTKTE